MEEKVKKMLAPIIEKDGFLISSIIYEKEGSINFLRIAIDREEVIPLNEVVLITRKINPVLDKTDLINEEYILDVYAKPKGDV